MFPITTPLTAPARQAFGEVVVSVKVREKNQALVQMRTQRGKHISKEGRQRAWRGWTCGTCGGSGPGQFTPRSQQGVGGGKWRREGACSQGQQGGTAT